MKRLLVLLPALLAIQVGVSPALAWTWPVDGPVLQSFRLGADPYEGGQHRGVDVGAPAGAPVVAPAAGAVSFAGTVPGGGQVVTIQTADGYSVTLVHLGTITAERGAVVGEGEPVGSVGPSGAPELPVPYVHLGIRVTEDENGYLDPLTFLPPRSVVAPAPGSQEEGAAPPEAGASPGSDAPPGEVPPGLPEPGLDDPRREELPQELPVVAASGSAAAEPASVPDQQEADGVGTTVSPALATEPAGEDLVGADAFPVAFAKDALAGESPEAEPRPDRSARSPRPSLSEQRGGETPASATQGQGARAHDAPPTGDGRMRPAEPARRAEESSPLPRGERRPASGNDPMIAGAPAELRASLHPAFGAKTGSHRVLAPPGATGIPPVASAPAARSSRARDRNDGEGWLSPRALGLTAALALGLLIVVGGRTLSLGLGLRPAASSGEPVAPAASTHRPGRLAGSDRPGRAVERLAPAELVLMQRRSGEERAAVTLRRAGELRSACRFGVHRRCQRQLPALRLPRLSGEALRR